MEEYTKRYSVIGGVALLILGFIIVCCICLYLMGVCAEDDQLFASYDGGEGDGNGTALLISCESSAVSSIAAGAGAAAYEIGVVNTRKSVLEDKAKVEVAKNIVGDDEKTN